MTCHCSSNFVDHIKNSNVFFTILNFPVLNEIFDFTARTLTVLGDHLSVLLLVLITF